MTQRSLHARTHTHTHKHPPPPPPSPPTLPVKFLLQAQQWVVTTEGKWRNGLCLCLDHTSSGKIVQSKCKDAVEFTLLPKNPDATTTDCGVRA